jgi:uncharacterized protein (TIGR04255 family)
MFRAEGISRISVRFINRLQLPGPTLDFDDYLCAGPKLPEGQSSLSAFTTSVVIPDATTQTTSILRQVFEPNSAAPPDKIEVIVDIDVVRESQLEAEDDAGLREALRDMRTVKNRLFFGSLTEKAVELFK